MKNRSLPTHKSFSRINLLLFNIVSSRTIKPDIKVTSSAIARLIKNLQEKHYMRFKLVVEKNDRFLGMLANQIVKNLSVLKILIREDITCSSLVMSFPMFYYTFAEIKSRLDYEIDTKRRAIKNQWSLHLERMIMFKDNYRIRPMFYKFTIEAHQHGHVSNKAFMRVKVVETFNQSLRSEIFI